MLRYRLVWVRQPRATRHALALWRCRNRAWTTLFVLPLWRKRTASV